MFLADDEHTSIGLARYFARGRLIKPRTGDTLRGRAAGSRRAGGLSRSSPDDRRKPYVLRDRQDQIKRSPAATRFKTNARRRLLRWR